MLSGSLFFRGSFIYPVYCTLCCQFLCFFDCFVVPCTFICPVSCVPYVVRFSAVFILLPLRGSLTFIFLYCVPYVARFSVFFRIVYPSWFPNVYFLCIVYPMLSGSPQCFFDCPFVVPNVYLSCVLCTLCCQFLCFSSYCVPYVFLFFLRMCTLCCQFLCFSSYCVPYVASFSVFLRIAPSWFPNVYLSCVLCTLCCQVLRSVFFIAPSWFPNVYFFLCIVYPMLSGSPQCFFWLPLRGSLTFIYPVYCVPYVVRFSAVFFFVLPLRGSLTFIFLSYCVPYVVRFSAVFIFDCPFVVP